MKTKIGKASQKKDGFCDSQTAMCEMILRVGALEERVAYLEEKARFPLSLTWTSCSHTGQPYYVNLMAQKQGVVAQKAG
jgi:hypothetical protein